MAAEHPGLSLRLRARPFGLALDLALEVPPGPLLLTGPNGAGKSSLLLLLLGLLRPEEGRVALGESVLFDSGAGVDLPPEARGLGYLPQRYALFPHLTALGNVEFAVAARRKGLPRAARRARAAQVLEQLGAGRLLERLPSQLSGGERQRVALCRALAAEPRALLLDEPLAALDAGSRAEVREGLAAELRTLGLPALVVSHDPRDAVALGDRVAVLEAGRLVQQGSLAELRAGPASAFVAAFAARALPATGDLAPR